MTYLVHSGNLASGLMWEHFHTDVWEYCYILDFAQMNQSHEDIKTISNEHAMEPQGRDKENVTVLKFSSILFCHLWQSELFRILMIHNTKQIFSVSEGGHKRVCSWTITSLCFLSWNWWAKPFRSVRFVNIYSPLPWLSLSPKLLCKLCPSNSSMIRLLPQRTHEKNNG